MQKNRKLPPYAKKIAVDQSYIVICTGTLAWDKAKSTTWLIGITKTVLPFGDDIATYKWPFVRNKEVLIVSNGDLESRERLLDLTRHLLRYGATLVSWGVVGYPMAFYVRNERLAA